MGATGISAGRWGFGLLAVAAACSHHAGEGASPEAPTPSSTPSAAVASPAAPAAVAPVATQAGVAPVVVEGGVADGLEAGPVAPPAPKVVLQCGDSMVGGYGGLTKALGDKFKDAGDHFVRDWEVSVSIATFDHQKRLAELLAKHKPDVVILTLGANDVFVPFPQSLAGHVASIARKASAGGRECYWMAPPLWKKDTGIVQVIKDNASPCKVFDASHLKIARGGDGIHPTDKGGETWASAFWAFYESHGSPDLATPGAP